MVNCVILQGRLTAAPELKSTNSGKQVVSFSVAVQEDRDHTAFIDCVAWQKTAEFICQYFQKGSMILIQGRLESRDFEDKTGNKRKKIEVVVGKVDFAGEKKADGGQSSQPPQQAYSQQPQQQPAYYPQQGGSYQPAGAYTQPPVAAYQQQDFDSFANYPMPEDDMPI